MIQLGGGPDLALETLDSAWMHQPILADRFESNPAAQSLVPGLEHLAHGTLAKQFQKQVLSKDESLSVSEHDLLDLVSGQPAPLHDLFSQRTRIRGRGDRHRGNGGFRGAF